MGTSETRAGYIQSPAREEYEKTTLVPEGGAEFNIPGNLVSLHYPPRSRLWVFLGNIPETRYPRPPWQNRIPKGPEKHQIKEKLTTNSLQYLQTKPHQG